MFDVIAHASIKNLRISPKKLNPLVDLIRNKTISYAYDQLKFSKTRIARDVKKCLESAVSNAENKNMDISNLKVLRVDVGKAFVMKRFHARARGRGARIEKPYSNLRIVVVEE